MCFGRAPQEGEHALVHDRRRFCDNVHWEPNEDYRWSEVENVAKRGSGQPKPSRASQDAPATPGESTGNDPLADQFRAMFAELKEHEDATPEFRRLIEQAEAVAEQGDLEGAFQIIQDVLGAQDDSFDEDALDEAVFDDEEDPLTVALELPAGKQQWRLQTAKDADSGKVVTAIVDEQDDLIQIESFEGQPSADQLRNFFLESIAEPVHGLPRKPAVLNVPTKALVGTLQKICGTVDVGCSQRKPTAEEKKHLQQLMKMLAVSESASAETADISELPQREETWLYGLFHPPLWIADQAAPRRGWFQLAADATAGLIVGTDVTEQQPTPEEMESFLRRAMSAPAVGDPRRPQQVLLDPADAGTLEKAPLESAGIAVGTLGKSEIFTELVGDLLARNGPTDGPLMEVDGVDAASLQRLYEACARVYESAPWQVTSGDQFLELSCSGWENTTWAACVTGQLGQEFGVSVYEDPDFVRNIMDTGEMDPKRMRCVIAHFQKAYEVIPADVWTIERHDWPVAGPDAYPLIVRYNPGPEVTRPSAEDLEILETAMTHLLRCLELPYGETMTVENPHPDQTQPLTLRWVS